MRKSFVWAGPVAVLGLLATSTTGFTAPFGNDLNEASYSTLSRTLVERAEAELARVQSLVEQGTLPKSRIAEAQENLADARDQEVLADTLYGEVRIQDMTPDQATAMLAAAQRRVERQERVVDDRQKLFEMGILAKSEFASCQDELDSRKRVLGLAQTRMQLLNELRQMVETEQRFERLSKLSAPDLKNVMVRFDGNGVFELSDLPKISAQFEKRFHRPLPVSALGQTALHQSMGLDHHNRVDVALNPDSPEGVWLRTLLVRLQVPYLAFRAAVFGAATAPHIHIGLGSSRLKLATR